MTQVMSVTNQQINSIIVHEDSHSPEFVYYLLRSQIENIRGRAAGAATPILNKTSFSNIELSVPLLPIQRRIASILCAYDDLIEVNRRRIAVLEEMARRLFDEWFVHFRFPGHEGHRMVETEHGRLPEGWAVRTLETAAEYISRGIAPKYDDSAEPLVISQKCIRNGRLSLGPARRQSKPIPAQKLVRSGDILVNSTGTGTLGRIAQVESVPSNTTTDSHVTIIRPHPAINADYLGHAVSRLQTLFESMATGATNQMELNRSRIAATEILVPQLDIMDQYGVIARSNQAMIFALEQQNNALAASRDLLLPRLISGELSVTEAKRELDAAA